MNWIEKIQNKPLAQKMRIIWTAAVVIAILMIMIWIIVIKIFHKKVPSAYLFINSRQQFNEDQKYYQENLQKRGLKIPNNFKIIK